MEIKQVSKKLLQRYSEESKKTLDEIQSVYTRAQKEERLLNSEEVERVKSLKERKQQIDSDREALIDIEEVRASEDKKLDRSVQKPSDLSYEEEEEIEQKRDAYKRSQRSRERVFSGWGEILTVCRSRATGELTEEQRGKLAAINKRAATGMSEGIDADGGILIEPEVAADLLEGTEKTSRLFGLANQRTVKSNMLKIPAVDEASRANGSVSGGLGVYPVAEADSYTIGSLKFEKVELQLKKIGCYAAATDEELEDVPALESRIASEVPKAFALELDRYIYEGDGSNVPHGFMNETVYHKTVAIESGQSIASNPILAENLTKMKSHILPGKMNSYVWLAGTDMSAQLPLITLGNHPIYLAQGTLSAAQNQALLLGLPIMENFEFCEALGTSGDLVLVAIKDYVVIKKGGLDSAASVHVRFLQDEQLFKFTMRLDGRMPYKSTITAAKGSHVFAPVIKLGTRS